ncbi:hypothetical protein TDB9533_04560 [Thalassocella blandensis]|nr:hypothetical protein TDB9533_04560 [Thalassocella blandensis]
MSFEQIFSISPLSWAGIGTSVICGSVVGLERQLRGKPVGIRTAALIVLGTHLFIACAGLLPHADLSRIVGQVITGVGFLGAGVMLAKDGVVVGVTSAATIWALAAIGAGITTLGEFTSIKLSILVVGILWGVDLLEDYSTAFTRGVHSKYRVWKKRNGNDE